MMAEIITAVTSVFTAAVDWISTLAGFIVDTPIVLFFIAIVVVSIAISWIKKFVPAMGGRRKRR